MNAKTFYPVILTPDSITMLESLEVFGFEGAHEKHGIAENSNDHFVLKNAEGLRVDVVETRTTPRTFTAIRVNVENFGEAVAYLTSKGFKNLHPETVESKSSKSTMMAAPDGVCYLITEHVK